MKVTDYGEVVILEGKAASEEEKNALGQIFEAYRQNVVNMLVVESKKPLCFRVCLRTSAASP